MHQGVLHVLFDFGYHVDVIDKEPVKKVLGNVASIGNEFAKKIRSMGQIAGCAPSQNLCI